MRWFWRVLTGFVILLLVAALVLAVLGPITVRRSFPQVDGQIQLTGLDGPVDIYRDSFGIPQIYASTQHDLFFAQGYVHAQDRFWQMDFQRHASSGRLAEMLGAAPLDIDRFLRTLGWERIARQELAGLDAESLAILQAYARGVNAYLSDHQGSALSLEYVFVQLLNRSYRPAPWEPLNTLTWAKAMAWNLGGNLGEEIDRALLLKTLTREQVDQLFPPYPFDRHPVIVLLMPETAGASQAEGVPFGLTGELLPVLQRLSGQATSLDALLGGRGNGIGSNNWVLSGALTDTGAPLLANDPHLGAQMPSIWYENGLHCTPRGPQCPFEVTGFSFVGAPGVIIGHNERIAWGATNLDPDVMDLYIEKINPANPDQYEVNGQWVDMQVVTETLHVAGGEVVQLPVRLTRHGPIISEVFGALEDFDQQAGVQLPERYAIALRWTALEPGFTFLSFMNINRARNWEEFRQALRGYAVPSQNFVYADVDGNIGYQSPGWVPIRAGGDGRLPVPGWTDAYEWTGFIPFEQLPFSFNPPEGYVVTANNAVVGPEYAYSLGTDWDYGFRARRIVEMIQQAPGPISVSFIKGMQGDDQNLAAARLLPILLQANLDDPRQVRARQLLQSWDGQDHMDAAAAALFESFWKHLLAATFRDELPEDHWPSGGDRWFIVVSNLVDQPDSPWWDDRSTPEIERRDQIIQQAFADAVEELERVLGQEPAHWTWGELHTLTFRHETMDNFPLINQLFNRGPFPTSGSSSVVNNTAWDAASDGYQVRSLPSMRMIVDLGNLANSLTMHTTGQSGHAYHPHYIDMAELWSKIQYHPMLWERTAVETTGESHLRLVP